MNKWPDQKKIDELLKKTKNCRTYVLPPDASEADKVKYSLCRNFIKYLHENNLNISELAKIVNVDRSVMSKIVHYHIDKFTIDRLINLYSKINSKAKFRIEIAS